MTCQQVRKALLRFPFIAPDGFLSAFSIPGPASQAPNVRIDNIGSPSTAIAPDPLFLAATVDVGAQKLNIPAGGLTGIGLAGDSAIHEFDVSLGGLHADNDRYRIDIGNPLLGIPTDQPRDFVTISLPNPVPTMFAVSPFLWVHDAIIIPYQGANSVWALPLRLELYYGGLKPVRQMVRPPLHVSARFTLQAASNAFLQIYVAGRSKLSVQTIGGTATGTISATEISYAMTSINTGGGVGRTGSNIAAAANLFSGAITQGLMKRFDVALTTPLTQIVQVGIVDSVGTAGGTPAWHQVDVYAWD
jgi:hypothetical protein